MDELLRVLLGGAPLLLAPEFWPVLVRAVDAALAGGAPNPAPYSSRGVERIAARRTVAIVPLQGFLSPRGLRMHGGFISGTSLAWFTQAVTIAVVDPRVDAVVVDIDSPGGMHAGTPEAAQALLSLRGTKPIIAVANKMAASAAYWLAAACDEIVASPSSMLGSIGVLAEHWDDSAMRERMGITRTIVKAGKYKAEMVGPLTDESRVRLQELVDAAYGDFTSFVARARNVSLATVRGGYGQGRLLTAAEARDSRVADSIADWPATLARIANGGNGPALRAWTDSDELERRLELERLL